MADVRKSEAVVGGVRSFVRERGPTARYAEEQRRFFGEVDVHLLAGCGHWPFIDEPERVAALIVSYLWKQLGVDASTPEGRDVV